LAEIVNLRQARKHKARADKETKAEANRAKFGQTKSTKTKVAKLSKMADKSLDQHKLDKE